MSPKVLDKVLARVPRATNANVMVGFDTSDDAGVYRLTDDCALVQTLDFFTPIVDDPFTFGLIAAANSLSDVYAMGGRPITALSILAYPAKGDLDDLAQILAGGVEKLREVDCVLLGGHSVADEEIKFGYSVTGTIHPRRILTNAGARPGDALVLTKALGTGVIGTALKKGIASEDHVAGAVRSMSALNRAACEAMLALDPHGCTDVTGFGLLGHAREMAVGAGVTIAIQADRVPLLDGAVEYALAGAIPGGLKNNREFVESCVAGSARAGVAELLYDPQTSGGLLISLSPADAGRFAEAFPEAAIIGRVHPRESAPLRIE